MSEGPLAGIKIIEMAGIGPGPFCGMLLADLGADVIRVDRTGGGMIMGGPTDVLHRSKRSIAVDLKTAEGIEVVLSLVERADVLFEGFRPGVMEKLGLGPDVCMQRNAQLVYGRMTGWGQHGPLAQAAGHDINYIAITGALDSIGRKEGGPVPPLNLVGDFAGGSMYLALGISAALLEANKSSKGQVIDVAITDGVISLMSAMHSFQALGIWEPGRQQNNLDGAAHYYDTYECADAKWISIGSIEPQFYSLLQEKLGIDLGESDILRQMDKSLWPQYKQQITAAFKQKTQSEWCEIMEGTDVCFAPVLSMHEAPKHPHNVARDAFVERDGVVQSAPAPRFSRTPGAIQCSAATPGEHTETILQELGFSADRIAALQTQGAVK